MFGTNSLKALKAHLKQYNHTSIDGNRPDNEDEEEVEIEDGEWIPDGNGDPFDQSSDWLPKVQSKGQMFQCPYCAYYCPVRTRLIRHIVHLHESGTAKNYKCGLCALSSLSKGVIHTHMKQFHPGQPVNIISLNKAAVSSPPKNLPPAPPMPAEELDEYGLPKTSIFNSPRKCPLCDFATQVRYNLIRHINSHVKTGANIQTEPEQPDKGAEPVDMTMGKNVADDNDDDDTADDGGGDAEGSYGDDGGDDDNDDGGGGDDGDDDNGDYGSTTGDYEEELEPTKSRVDREPVSERILGTNLHRCMKCDFTHRHIPKVRRHFYYKHANYKPFQCAYCQFSAVESGKVKRHCATMHEGVPMRVLTYTDTGFRMSEPAPSAPTHAGGRIEQTVDKAALARQMGITKKGPYEHMCDYCGYVQECKSAVLRHIYSAHLNFHPYKCKYCSYSAVEKCKVKLHIEHHHVELPLKIVTRKYKGQRLTIAEHNAEESEVQPSQGSSGTGTGTAAEVPTATVATPSATGDWAGLKVKSEPVSEPEDNDDAATYDSATYESIETSVPSVADDESVGLPSISASASQVSSPSPVPISTQPHISEAKYFCDKCPFMTKWQTDMKKHNKRHTIKSENQCGYCTYSASYKHNVRKHWARVHNDQPFLCFQNGMSVKPAVIPPKNISQDWMTYREDTLQAGPARRTASDWFSAKACKSPLDNLYYCPHCPYKTKQNSDLRKHNRRHEGKHTFTCGYCSYGSNAKRGVVIHLASAHKELPQKIRSDFGEDVMLSSYPSLSGPPMLAPEPQSSVLQDSMNQQSSSTQNNPNSAETIRQILKHSTSLYSKKCKFCSFTDKHKARVRRHMYEEHLGYMPYRCKYCGLSSLDKRKMMTHVKTAHSDKPPEYCVIGSDSKGAVHVNYLTVEWRSRMPQSGSKLRGNIGGATSSLMRYDKYKKKKMKYTVKDGRYQCEYCSFSAPTRDSMYKHKRFHFAYRPYGCKYCTFKAYSRIPVKSHMSSRHPELPLEVVEYPKPVTWDADGTNEVIRTLSPRENVLKEISQLSPSPSPSSVDNADGGETVRISGRTYQLDAEGLYTCAFCPYQTEVGKNLTRHVSTHYMFRPFKCAYCTLTSLGRRVITNHQQGVHPGLPIKVIKLKKPPEMTLRADDRRIVTKPEKAPEKKYIGRYKCSVCPYRTRYEVTLNRHIMQHTGVSPTKPGMPATTSASGGADQEATITQDVVPGPSKNPPDTPDKKATGGFACKTCNFMTTYKWSMTAHLMRHINYRPAKCGHCNYSNQKWFEVKKHCQIIHSNKPVKVHMVRVAKKEMELQDGYRVVSLGEAMGSVRKLKPRASAVPPSPKPPALMSPTSSTSSTGTTELGNLRCPQCGYLTPHRTSLLRHIMRHFDYKPYSCPHCSYRDIGSGGVSSHMKMVHDIDKPVVKVSKRPEIERKVSQQVSAAFDELREQAASGNIPISEMTQSDPPVVVKKEDIPEVRPPRPPPLKARAAYCSLCGETRPYVGLRSHIMRHFQYKPYSCNKCNYKDVAPSKVAIHMLHVHKDTSSQPIENIDPKIAERVIEYIKQSKLVDPPSTSSPRKVGGKAKIESEDEKSLPEVKKSKVERISMSDTATGEANQKADGEEETYYCPICRQYSSANLTYLAHHIQRLHIKYKPFKCPECAFQEITPYKVKRHWMRIHDGEPPKIPYRPVKSKQRILKAYLKQAQNGETTSPDTLRKTIPGAAGRHACTMCLYKTTNTTMLRCHTMQHLHYKPYKCQYCEQVDITEDKITNHIRTVHPNKKLVTIHDPDKVMEDKLELLINAAMATETVAPSTSTSSTTSETTTSNNSSAVNSPASLTKKYVRSGNYSRKAPPGVFMCDQCNYKTTHGYLLMLHQRRHGPPRVKCYHCDYRAYESHEISKHWKGHHKDRKLPYRVVRLSAEDSSSVSRFDHP